ncbi:hypothetical protein FE633_11260 [Streptomyces montanus]|uniref:DUF6545 domain-containing protein n=1 Tax=Streptomyces montanus TaxID=2580423 RepID=A0A5R9G3H9_9ACTN|nr:MAB_1171c family putative transporter [Streptomyces montanus]TLS46115.1 hypothetical protein FE633_11260 [Streptomyces montanus]
MLFNVVYGILSVITWTAFFFKVKDLARDWGNKELRLLCLAISTFAIPFFFAAPAVYVRVDALLGIPNVATLIIYTSVAICLTSFLALLVSWASAQSKMRLHHRLLVGYAVATIIAMTTFFFLGTVNDGEHPVNFDVYYAGAPYISQFLLVYQVLYGISMVGLIRLCWRYSTVVDRPWLRRGLRVVTGGAVAGMGYCLPKIVSLTWDLIGTSPLDFANSVIAPMFASLSAVLFAVGFTMPAWGVGLDRTTEWISQYRTFHRRYPLWEAITNAFPELVLYPPPASRKQLARDLRLLHYRQFIEIRDGEMQLRPHYDPEVTRIARDLAAARGITGDMREAVTEAAQIAAVLHARATGQEVPPSQNTLLHDPAEGDLRKEGIWLTQVADAFRTSPVIPAVLERLEAASTDT